MRGKVRKKRGEGFGEMIKAEIDVWVRPRPDRQELRFGMLPFVPQPINSAAKRESKKWTVDPTRFASLPSRVCLPLSCFVLCI